MRYVSIIVIIVVTVLCGCSTEKQHPTTVNQMRAISAWSKRVDNRIAGMARNFQYIYPRLLSDPNEIKEIEKRLDMLEQPTNPSLEMEIVPVAE